VIVSSWKPEKEIRRSLDGAEHIAVLSCNGCAEQCGTGGQKGINDLAALLHGWGKQIVVTRLVEECCDEGMLQQALGEIPGELKKCDALILICCAAGIKAAFLCQPQAAIRSVLDTLGGGAYSTTTNAVTESLCKGCGACVISCTGGICPVSACPASRKYSPCKSSPEQDGPCCIRAEIPCAWRQIDPLADRDALEGLRRRQTEKG